MRNLLIISIFILLVTEKVYPCGDYYDEYNYYSLIFSQELINDSRYYPFLRAWDVAFYEADSAKVKNANIEEWQKYLKITYEQAYYLVFKASTGDIQKLLSGKSVKENQLKFADSRFSKKYNSALQYLLQAKELEPFMRISGSSASDGWHYYEKDENDVDGVPYDVTSLKLQKAWKQVKEKELKQRYGYLLVRLAHYKRNYEEAIEFFDTYVEPLNYKSEIYYYALSQKAGAVRGTGDVATANNMFMEVFTNSSDLKKTAFSSIKLNENVDYKLFLSSAKTDNERNDIDLLLGFISFSNPLPGAEKIVKRSPDAIQAKVLVARSINAIEDDIKIYGDVSEYTDKRFPILKKSGYKNFTDVKNFVIRQTARNEVKQKNYWNVAAAYLCYLERNYTEAKIYLNKVDIKEPGYKDQRDILAMLVDISKEPVINDEVEKYIFTEYNDVITKKNTDNGRSKVADFVTDILSNRYYLQKDYAKSFILENSLAVLQDNPNLTLLNEIEAFYYKPNKNSFEKYLADNFTVGSYGYGDKIKATVPDYLYYMKGMVYLTNDELDKAKEMFDKSNYSDESVSSDIFGYNRIECYTCNDNMETDYLSEYAFIEAPLNEKDIVNVLLELKKEADGSGLRAAKANYLLGNFFYNTSVVGYFRNYLRFGYNGGFRQEFFCPVYKNNIFEKEMYLKSIPTYYDNPTDIADKYLKRAYTLASGDELKARIVFALSKCELEIHYQKIAYQYCNGNNRGESEDPVLITDRRYFKELMKYKNTSFFDKVQSNCKYFDYYVNHL